MEFKHFETNLEKENEYPKLVRDNIPEIVSKITGREVKTKVMESDEEFASFLLKKIEEEAHELSEAKDKEHVMEEMADLSELFDAISEFYGFDLKEVREIQRKKADKRGGFKKRILMLEKA
jgi:predicted house-cleaning noncanonical NTP pyrophosphatase (MazG superfamily)